MEEGLSYKQVEAMLRRLRKIYPEITVVLASEKEYISMRNLPVTIELKARALKTEYDISLHKWKGARITTRVNQLKEEIKAVYRFDNTPGLDKALNEIIEKVLTKEGYR